MKSFIILFICISTNVLFADMGSRWITAESGLRIRSNPDLNAKTIVTIPYGSEVTFLEKSGDELTISGTTGYWTKIEWNDKTGWVFGGFLTKVSGLELLNKMPLEFILSKNDNWFKNNPGVDDNLIPHIKICPEGDANNNYPDPGIWLFNPMDADYFIITKVEKNNEKLTIYCEPRYDGDKVIFEYEGTKTLYFIWGNNNRSRYNIY